MIQKQNKSLTFKINATEEGLHLKDTILWFDTAGSNQLSFLSYGEEQKISYKGQVITSEETMKILEVFRTKPSALVCPFNRPFSIGHLKMELLPSGLSLGSANLYVETGQQSLLYAPYTQLQKTETHRKAQFKKAKILILRAVTPNPKETTPNRSKVRDEIKKNIKELYSEQRWPIIYCQSTSIAQELTKLISGLEIPITTHHNIYKINKLYESYGLNLGQYSLYSSRRIKGKVIILPFSSHKRMKSTLSIDEHPSIIVKNTHDEIPKYFNKTKIEKCFDLPMYSTGSEFNEIISQVKPKELLFFGPYAKKYAEYFKGSCSQVKAIFQNDQPTLF